MRSDEIKNLQWCQVDLFAQVLTVGKSKTDAGTGRAIPLNAAAVKALADWGEHFPARKPEHYIFPRYEGTFSPALADPSPATKGWRTAWRNACKRAELKLRFHDLRHTAITKLAESQASDQTIMAIAGHVSRAMLEHYSRIRMTPSEPPWMPSQHPGLSLSVEKHPIFRVMCTKLVTKSRCTKIRHPVSY